MTIPIFKQLFDSVRIPPADRLAVAMIAGLWALLVLPSGFLNGLFALDQGGVYHLASQFPGNLHWILSPHTGSGRYVPVYWLYHCLPFLLFSFNVTAYYFLQSILFLASALLTGLLFARLARSRAIIILFCASLFISTPNVETLYTICKPEPLLYTFLIAALFAFRWRSADGQPIGLGRSAVITLLFALALWSKETAIAMLAFPIAGALLTLLFRSRRTPRIGHDALLQNYIRMAVCLVLGLALSRAPYILSAGTSARTQISYTKFTLTWEIVVNNIVFYATQQPDVLGFGVLAAILMLWLVKDALRAVPERAASEIGDLIFTASLVVMAWAYCAGYAIWRWPMAYYLYPPAILFRFAACYGFYAAASRRMFGQRTTRLIYGSAAGLLVYASVYIWYAGTTQVVSSQMYTTALHSYAKLGGDKGSLILEALPFYAEQVTNTAQLFEVALHRPKRVYGIGDVVNPTTVTRDMRDMLSITDADLANNEKHMPVKGDYVLVFTGDRLATWQVRGAAPIYSDGSFLQKDAAYEMTMVDERMAFHPVAFVNVWTFMPELRQSYLGFKMYKVTSGPRFTWFGRYPDGWIGKEARLTLYPEYVRRALVHIRTSSVVPHNTVRLYREGALMESAVLSAGSDRTFSLACCAAGKPTTFRLQVERTFVPRRTYFLNRDDRQLGALVRLEPFGDQPQ